MKKLFSFLLISVLMLTLCTASVGAKSGSALDLAITSKETGENELSVSVTVQNISETLHVVEFVVAYDAEKLELINTVDEEGVLDCIPSLPENWENFAGVTEAGSIKAQALTANMEGLKDGELTFEFKFRIKDGAKGETVIDISEDSVLGAYVGNDEINEFGGKGGSVTVTLTEDGEVGEISADSVSKNDANGDPNGSGSDEEESDSTVIIIVCSVIGALIVAAAVVLIIKKKK